MNRAALLLSLGLLMPAVLDAQIRVNPTGVNVNAQAATTVFLTFGGVRNYVPVEAIWCGALVPAAPDAGLRCDPATIYGRLPLRYDRSRVTDQTFTDIMSIPASVSRRAYEAASNGETSSFFYVRRFRSTTGGPDQYVAVTCRLAGGGARVPFALTHVDLRFAAETPILFTQPGQPLHAFEAEINYNGTGRLRGRWEIVLPGDEPPSAMDLLTEATLPASERGLQKRYREIDRFNVFLPPNGRVVLPGPDPARLPNDVEGQYLILLRVEATDDKEGDSSLAAVGAGQGILHSGAVAGFPMPTLRYVVGAGASRLAMSTGTSVHLLAPTDRDTAHADSAAPFKWSPLPAAHYYKLELQKPSDASVIFSAIVTAQETTYQVPAFAWTTAAGEPMRWRVTALDTYGNALAHSEWRSIHVRR